MQYQSEITDTNKLWTEAELKDLILYTQHLRKENEDLQAKMIMMQAKLNNEESKVKKLSRMLYAFTNGTLNI